MPTQHEIELRDNRNIFYEGIRNNRTNPAIVWSQPAGNHMNFRFNNYHGYVNWYFRNIETNRFGGNVCVVFWNNNITAPVEGFAPHPKSDDKIIAVSDIENVDEAVEWALIRIISISNR